MAKEDLFVGLIVSFVALVAIDVMLHGSVRATPTGYSAFENEFHVSTGSELCNRDLFPNYNLSTCEPGVNDADLSFLADAVYIDNQGDNDNEAGYKQDIKFISGPELRTTSGQFGFFQDDDDAPVAGAYLLIDDSQNTPLYEYKLEFDQEIIYNGNTTATAKEDLKDTTLSVMGRDYVITNVRLSSTNALDRVDMISGEADIWLSQGQTIRPVFNGERHIIKLLDVTENITENEGSCILEVDGQQIVIDVEKSAVISGFRLGVVEGRALHEEAENVDMCRVVLGAHKLTIIDEQRIQINEEDIDGTVASISSTAANTLSTWSNFRVRVAPDISESNKIYLGVGDEWVDPVFGTFKLVFGSVESGGRETIKFTAGGTSAKIRFQNEDGQEVVLPLSADKGYITGSGASEPVFWGTDAPSTQTSTAGGSEWSVTKVNKRLYFHDEICAPFNSDVNACEGMSFLVCTANRHAHVVKMTSIDTLSRKISFRDVTYGVEMNERDYEDNMGFTSLDLGGELGTLVFNITNASIQLMQIDLTDNQSGAKVNGSHSWEPSLADGPSGNSGLDSATTRRSVCEVETLQEGFLIFNEVTENNTDTVDVMSGSNTSRMNEGVLFREGADNDLPAAERSFFVMNASYDDINDQNIEWRILNVNTSAVGFGPLDESADNSDIQKFFSRKGTLVTFDDEKQQFVEIDHPHDRVYARVLITNTSFQYEQGKSIPEPILVINTTLPEGEYIELCEQNLFYGRQIAECHNEDVEGLNMIKRETFIDNEGDNYHILNYTQRLFFPQNQNSTGQFVFEQENSNAPYANPYIFINGLYDIPLYKYVVTFDNEIVYNTTLDGARRDFDGTTFKLLGKNYTITYVRLKRGYPLLDIIEMIDGEAQWLSIGETYSVTINGNSHTVELIDVTEDIGESTGSCVIQVDGQQLVISVDHAVRWFDGNWAILEGSTNPSRCRVVGGAREITLFDNRRLEVNREPLSWATSRIISNVSGDTGRWSGFEISVPLTPDVDYFPRYLGVGQEIHDPVFDSFKLLFGTVESEGIEIIKIVSNESRGEVTFINDVGENVTILLSVSGGKVVYDDGTDHDTEYATRYGGKITIEYDELNNKVEYLLFQESTDETLSEEITLQGGDIVISPFFINDNLLFNVHLNTSKGFGLKDYSNTNSNVQAFTSYKGTTIFFAQRSNNIIKIYHPNNRMYARMFLVSTVPSNENERNNESTENRTSPPVQVINPPNPTDPTIHYRTERHRRDSDDTNRRSTSQGIFIGTPGGGTTPEDTAEENQEEVSDEALKAQQEMNQQTTQLPYQEPFKNIQDYALFIWTIIGTGIVLTGGTLIYFIFKKK